MDSLARAQTEFVAFDKNLNIDDILFKYGVRINGDLVAGSKIGKAADGSGQIGQPTTNSTVPFYYYPSS